jgi:lysine 2,3-aminomutase
MPRRHQSSSPVVPLREVADRLGVAVDDGVRRAARRFPLRFPRDYVEGLAASGALDALAGLGWPAPEEAEPESDAQGLADPVGERPLVEGDLVIRKYPDRVILLATSRCHFYCRFCFRANHKRDPTLDELRAAIRGMADAPAPPREVILSGGDPLVLTDEMLRGILDALGELPSLETVRIHTRAPIHEPGRASAELARLLARAPRRVWVAVHASHPAELGPKPRAAIERLREAGVPLLSQTVLLRGVNDDPALLAELFATLYAWGVSPYYLHHPDRVPGTARFRLPVAEGRRIARALRGRIPGAATPTYVLDTPDGGGKVPVDWLERVDETTWRVERADGRVSIYEDV